MIWNKLIYKILFSLKNIFHPAYYSCSYIQQNAINFYPANNIKMCCFTSSSALDLANIEESNSQYENLHKIINKNRKKYVKQFKDNKIPNCCKDCPNLRKKNWFSKDKDNKIKLIVLNHYMSCNLRCKHCGYLKKVKNKLRDTKDETVLQVIKILEHQKELSPNYYVDIGGGEPSLSPSLDKIINYVTTNNHKVHINSNGARFKANWIDDIKKGLINLTLTPDAGSKEVYKNIKGVDYFDIMQSNLRQYMQLVADKVSVKFIIEAGNINDIDNMLDFCIRNGVKQVICSFDLNIKKAEYPKYKLVFKKFQKIFTQAGYKLQYTLIPDEFLQK